MNKRLISGLCGAALLLVSAASSPSPAAADSLSLFIRKAQVTATERAGKVYAPASELLKAMGYQWTVDGSTVRLVKGAAGGPTLAAATTYTFVLPNGKSVSTDVMAVKKEAWILVRPLAEAAGGTYIATPAAGIVQVTFSATGLSQKDVDRAVRDSKHQEGISAPPLTDSGSSGDEAKSADKGGKTADTGDKKPDSGNEGQSDEKKEEVIKVTNLDFYNPIIPGSKVPAELRGTATIKNTSDKRVTNIKFTVELRDLGDNPVTTLPTKFISALEPGETASQDFLWYNYYNQTLTPKVKIEHDPLPTPKKKADAKAGDKGGEKGGDTKKSDDTSGGEK